MKQKIKDGQTCIIIANQAGHFFNIGETVIVEFYKKGSYVCHDISQENQWSVGPNDLKPKR